MNKYKDYEAVIGLEIHVELKTETKVFCSCKNVYGAAPNTRTCPVCLGHPGALPVLNGRVKDFALRLSLALGGEVQKYSRFDRKNYFYADMPKAYQITQFYHPICLGGSVEVNEGGEKLTVGITRIHIEEDAGKLTHGELETEIDYNRAGVPLLEIVTEPCFENGEQVKAFLKKLRTIILYTGISDCKMNEGSLRCDVNLSVRKAGETDLRERTEIKNLNSFLFAQKAIEAEYRRQCEVYENGGEVTRETLRFNPSDGKVYTMRKKESVGDYRYFPEPDLKPLVISDEEIESVRKSLPEMPEKVRGRYIRDFGLSFDDAENIAASPETARYFDNLSKLVKSPKAAASFILGEITAVANGEEPTRINPESFAAVCDLFTDSEINSSTAKKLLRDLWSGDFEVIGRVDAEKLRQINDVGELAKIAAEAIAKSEKLVADYKGGKLTASKAIMGQAMRLCQSRANPEKLEEIILSLLEKI